MRTLTATSTVLLLCTVFAGTLVTPTPAKAREASWPGQTLTGRDCSEFAYTHGYGPYNYNNPRHRRENLPIVEKAHFTEEVRTLRSGANAASPLGDLEYTLGAFPNHHQALYSMIRYATEAAYQRESEQAWKTTSRLGRVRPPAECYLQRAINFAPEDHRAHMLYGLFLHRTQEYNGALDAYKTALQLKPSSAEVHYNIGLLLFDMKRYDESIEHARNAYKLDYPLEGLKNRLTSKGYKVSE